MAKNYSLEYSNGSPTPSGGVIWSGEKIDCLGICPGQTLNRAVALMADKICELAAPQDLSTLTLECALEVFGKEESGNRTITSVLQLLADNDCGLKELFDSLQAQVDGIGNDPLVLDLKCLAERDTFGNPLPYDNQSVLQGLINEVCSLIQVTDGLSGKVLNLQNQIDDINKRIPDSDEKIISTCVSADEPISQAIIDVAEDHCNLKSAVGSVVQIQQAIAKQCNGLSDELQTTLGWIIAPGNLAQSFNNLWIAHCNLLARVETIENTCCSSTCKDVTIGMEIITSADGKGVSLKFSSAAGTSIPSGWLDKGSTVEFKDIDDKILTYSVEISQDGTSDELSLVGLNLNGVISISLTAIVGNESLTCEKCVSQTFSPSQSCPVCAVSVTGKIGAVTIIYEIPSA